MSLTGFIKIPVVKQMFASIFPLSRVKFTTTIQAPPITKNYLLIGTAFDYLLRFYLQRLNPNSITRSWVAEEVPGYYGYVEHLKNKTQISGPPIDPEELKRDTKLFRKTNDMLTQAKNIHKDYIKNGQINNGVFRASILLAQLDFIARGSFGGPDIENILDDDIEDLHNLISIVDDEKFKAKSSCILNPTFGRGSKIVGAADADLIIDGNLIDIKTTKYLSFNQKEYNQLIGYYVLSKIGLINDSFEYEISQLSIYYSRFGVMHTIPVSIIQDNPDFEMFIKWFKQTATKLVLNYP